MITSISRRQKIILASIAIFFVIILVLISTTGDRQQSDGSTYSRTPGGYAAWYGYMQDQGTKVQRWQKPAKALTSVTQPMTLLRIQSEPMPRLPQSGGSETKWLAQGNRLIYVGVKAPATAAPFSNLVPTEGGDVKIETRRRWSSEKGTLLKDEFGALIEREHVGRGEIIWIIPPYLAANAYQEHPANYQLLARLALENDLPIWVDEYLHGYKDAETIAEEVAQNVGEYLLKTPLLLVLIQAIFGLGIALSAGNKRFGPVIAELTPRINNNMAYIDALATVLEKAESTEFVTSHLPALGDDSAKPAANNKELEQWLQRPQIPPKE